MKMKFQRGEENTVMKHLNGKINIKNKGQDWSKDRRDKHIRKIRKLKEKERENADLWSEMREIDERGVM